MTKTTTAIPGGKAIPSDKEFTDGMYRMMTSPENIGLFELGLDGLFEQGLDLGAQLLAIKNLIRRNQEAAEGLDLEVDSLQKEVQQATYEPGSWEEAVQDGAWINRLHDGNYQSAAHSMAATAMLAPFVEVLFVRIFERIQDYLLQTASNDERIQIKQQLWNPKNHKKGLSSGISCLADRTGLAEFLPDDYHKTVGALTCYRNAMFHNGFGWVFT